MQTVFQQRLQNRNMSSSIQHRELLVSCFLKDNCMIFVFNSIYEKIGDYIIPSQEIIMQLTFINVLHFVIRTHSVVYISPNFLVCVLARHTDIQFARITIGNRLVVIDTKTALTKSFLFGSSR